jgi:hypothetical protein
MELLEIAAKKVEKGIHSSNNSVLYFTILSIAD